MENAYDWVMLYQTYFGKIEEYRFAWFHGVSLFGSFIFFGLTIYKGFRFKDGLEKSGEWFSAANAGTNWVDRRAPGYMFFSWHLAILYYAIVSALLAWAAVVKTLGVHVTAYLPPLILIYFTLGPLEKKVAPDKTTLQKLLSVSGNEKNKIPGAWGFKTPQPVGCIIFPIIFFSFMTLNSGLTAYAMLRATGSSHNPYAVWGKVVAREKGARTDIFLTLDVSEARILTAKGLSGPADLPERYRVESDVFETEGISIGDEVVLIVSDDQAIAFIAVNELNKNGGSL